MRLTYGTASTMTFNGSVNDVFLTYGEKCVLSPNTDNKSLNGLFHFDGHQKNRCDFYTNEHATDYR